MKRIIVSGVLLIAAWSCTPKSEEYKVKAQNPDFLHRTLDEVTHIMIHDIFSPPVASRVYVYTSIAGYEAIIPQDSSYISLAGQLHGFTAVPRPQATKEYCFPLASVQAMVKVGKSLLFSEDRVDAFYDEVMNDFKNTGIPNDVFKRSVEYGDQVAEHVLQWAAKDNYAETRSFPKYTISSDPGSWKPTPPGYMEAIEPSWNKLRTFVIDSAAQFAPKPPTSFSSVKSSPFFKEAMETYEVGKSLSDEQKEIAAFWDCNPFVMNVTGHVMYATKLITPGGHWINIARMACRQTQGGPVRSAEAYAVTSIALADAFISCWDEKYRSVLIRPETYINQYIDENWLPLLQTPPFPEYTSGHSVISSAAATALTDLFGDNFAFADSTEVEFGLPVRHFKSFVEARDEAAISRLYGGIHYRPAIENGVGQGVKVGELVTSRIKTRDK